MQIRVSLRVDIPASADINEIEHRVQEAGRQAMRAATQQAVRAAEEQRQTCPHCGSEVSRSEGTDHRIMLTKFGRVELPLRRQRCQACQRRFRPADACLKRLQGGNVTAALSRACSEAGASFPSMMAAQVVNDVCGAQMSPEHGRRLTNRTGSQEAAPSSRGQSHRRANRRTGAIASGERVAAGSQEEASATSSVAGRSGWRLDQEPGAQARHGRQSGGQCQRDGSARQARPTAHDEPSRQSDLRACQSAWHAQLGGTCQLQAEQAPTQVVGGDGAEWIKTEAEVHFPQAVKILDWPHLWRKIHAAIRVMRPGQSKSARQFRKGQYETLSPLLWQGQGDAALAQLQALRPGTTQEPIDQLEEAISYVHKQRDWMGNYQQWQEAGYPVGSGLVERGVAVVINPRMKRRGMRWKRANATAVVALRVCLLKAAWEKASAKRRAAA